MNSPKEALEYVLDCFRDGIGSTDNEQEAIAEVEAAIPVAELHQQLAELILNQSNRPSDFWAKVHEIRTRLEALK